MGHKSDKTGATRVLFLFPPFWDATSPYLSIPQLTAYLERQGVSVRACDLNLALVRWSISVRGSRKIMDAMRAILQSRKLPKKEFSDMLAWAKTWSNGLVEDHAVARRILGRRGLASARDYYRGYEMVKRSSTLMNLLERARQHDPSIPYPQADVIQSLIANALGWKPHIVAFSTVSSIQLKNAIDYSEFIRDIAGHQTRIAIGGPASTIAFGTVFDESAVPDSIDSCAVGQGEKVLTKLIRMLEQGEPWPKVIRADDYSGVNDTLIPRYDYLPVGDYLSSGVELCYPFSDGCYWHKCRYCNKTVVPKYSARPGKIVAAQLKALKRKFGCSHFVNTGSALAPKDACDIARSIGQSGEVIKWRTMVRPEKSWTKSRFDEIRRGGAKAIQFGVESLSDHVLCAMKRGLTAEVQMRTIERAFEGGLKPTIFLIFDFPGETYEDFLLTLKRMKPYASRISNIVLSGFQLFPDSDVAEDPEAYGIKVHRPGSELRWQDCYITAVSKGARDLRRINRKRKALDAWIHSIHRDESMLFFKSGEMWLILFDDESLFGDNVKERLVNSGYYHLDRILKRRYRLNTDRIKKRVGKNSKPQFVLRDQMRVISGRSPYFNILCDIGRGIRVGGVLGKHRISPKRDVSVFNMMIQFINTLDIMGALIALHQQE